MNCFICSRIDDATGNDRSGSDATRASAKTLIQTRPVCIHDPNRVRKYQLRSSGRLKKKFGLGNRKPNVVDLASNLNATT